MNSTLTVRLPSLSGVQKPVERVPTFSETEVSDEVLIARSHKGDQDALALLFRRYARLVRAMSYRILRDAAEADDLLQEVFLFIHRKGELFDCSKSSARSWIVQVTYHRAIDRRRYLHSRHFYTPVNLEDVGAELERSKCANLIETTLDREGVRRLFDILTDNQRKTLILFFFDGCSFDEIAEKLGQSRGNIKNHYFRGLHKLRKQIFDDSLRHDSAV